MLERVAVRPAIVDEVLLCAHGQWSAIDFDGGRASLAPLAGPTPQPGEFDLIVAVLGMLRNFQPLLAAQLANVPVLVVPSAHPTPLRALLPKDSLLHGQNPVACERTIRTALRARAKGGLWRVPRTLATLDPAARIRDLAHKSVTKRTTE